MTDLDDLEQAILDRINPIPNRAAQEAWTSDRTWTKFLLLALAEMGHERGFYVCGSACGEYGQGEWLYDLVWLQNEHSYIKDVPLILESEWSPNLSAVSDDFMKLLLGRAQHRVMVFQAPTPKKVSDVIEELTTQVRNFGPTREGDRYLFLGFDWAETKRFNPAVFVA